MGIPIQIRYSSLYQESRNKAMSCKIMKNNNFLTDCFEYQSAFIAIKDIEANRFAILFAMNIASQGA